MAHFAQLDENNIVIQVIVVSNDDVKNSDGEEVEQIGIDFCKNLFGSNTNWKQTSYHSNMRVRYANIGYSYDEILDAFIPPKPYPSWVLNETTANWESPVGPAPILTMAEMEEGLFYSWDDENIQWKIQRRPPVLTEEQVQSRKYYRWDEETESWVLDTYVPAPGVSPQE